MSSRGSTTGSLELTPKQKRAKGDACCEPVVYPDIERERAERLAQIAKALGDPIRMQLVDVLRKHAGKVCVCELVPLFDLSQPTVSHHLKVLREAGLIEGEKRGTWVYYRLRPDAVRRLASITASVQPVPTEARSMSGDRRLPVLQAG